MTTGFERMAMAAGAAIGAVLSFFLGGISPAVVWMTVFMAVDYATGICASIITGQTCAWRGLKGIAKKGLLFMIVVLCHGADVILGTTGIRDGAVFAIIINEAISCLENIDRAGLGVYIPAPLRRALKKVENEQTKGETSP